MSRQDDLIEANNRSLLTGKVKEDFDMAVERGIITIPSQEETTLDEPQPTTIQEKTQATFNAMAEGKYSDWQKKQPIDSRAITEEYPYPLPRTIMDQYKQGALPERKKNIFDEIVRRGAISLPGGVTSLPATPGAATEEERRAFSDVARPTISGVTSAFGAMAGTPGAPGAGTLVGGGLGFALGEELADKLDEFMGLRERQPLLIELKESAEQAVKGAAYEAGGQSIFPAVAPGIKWAISKIPRIALTGRGAAKIGAKVIAAETSQGPIFAKNIEEARALEEAIPGLKFSRGEMTGDPEIIKFERARATAPGDVAAEQLQRSAENSKALRTFIDTQKGKGDISDVLGPLEKERVALGAGAEATGEALAREARAIETGVGGVEAGPPVRKALSEGERAARKDARLLFEDVPEFDIDASKLVTKIDELSQPMNKFEAVGKNVPEEFAQIKAVLEESDGIATPQDLQGLRSSLTDSLRDAQGAASPNNRMISRINQMIGEVDSVLKEASESGERVTKEFITNPAPSVADLKEYEVLTKEARVTASENIKALRKKENVSGYKASLEEATEIVNSSSDYSDFTDIISQGGLNLETAHMMSDKDTIRELMRRRPTLFRRGASLHAEHYANKKGFDTPDELFQDWLTRDKRQDKIRSVADDLFNEFQAGKEMELSETGFEEFLNEEIKMTNKLLGKKPPKGVKPDPIDFRYVKTKQLPGDEAAAQKLKTAQQFFKKEVIDKFKAGTPGDILRRKGGQYKVTNANIASRFFKAGPKGQEAAQEFMNAVGKDKDALNAMRDYIKQDLIDKSTNPNTGEIVKTKLNSWLAKNRKALEVYGMGREFNSIKKAQGALEDAITLKTEFNKSVASKMLGADVDSAIGKAFQKGSTRVSAINLMRQVKGDKKAVNGLQNGIIDHIITTAETTAPDFLGNKIISLAGFEKEFKKMLPAMKIVFKDAPLKMKALTEYRTALGRMQALKKSPTLVGGPDTAEKIISNIAYGLGAGKSRVLNILRTVAKPLLTLSDDMVNGVLNRAAVDPDFAYTLQLIAKGRKPDMIERRLKGHIASLGLKITEQPQEKK